jgi:hypothetical protein
VSTLLRRNVGQGRCLAAPRARGDREAVRMLLAARHGAVIARTKVIGQLKALIVNAPEALRDQLRRGSTDEQLDRCARLRTCPPTASSTAPPSAPSAPPPAAPCSWKPRPPNTKPSSNSWCWPPARRCSTCPASASSPAPSSWCPGRTPDGSATRPPSPPSPASHPSRPAAERPSGTGSTDPAIAEQEAGLGQWHYACGSMIVGFDQRLVSEQMPDRVGGSAYAVHWIS